MARGGWRKMSDPRVLAAAGIKIPGTPKPISPPQVQRPYGARIAERAENRAADAEKWLQSLMGGHGAFSRRTIAAVYGSGIDPEYLGRIARPQFE